MRAKRTPHCLIFLAGLLGTSETIASEASMVADDATAVQSYLADRPDLILCATYSLTHSKALRTELVNRKLLSASELDEIPVKYIATGMSKCAFLSNYGIPAIISTKLRYRLKGFPHEMFKDLEPFDAVYSYSDRSERFYVFADGRLKSIVGVLE